MFLIPEARLERTTSLPVREVRERFEQSLKDTPPPEVPPPFLAMSGPRYEGRIDDAGFRLQALSRLNEGTLPTFEGTLTGVEGGTRISGVVRVRRAQWAGLIILLLAFVLLSRSPVMLVASVVCYSAVFLLTYLPHKNAFEAWLGGLPSVPRAAEQGDEADEP